MTLTSQHDPLSRPAAHKPDMSENIPGEMLLLGVTGSRAYGFHTASSDTDRRGVFAAPTALVLGLSTTPESHNTNSPDVALHELRRFVSLLTQSNPTAMELLWLPSYEILHPVGEELVAARNDFLSARQIRNAYAGTATGLIRKLERRACSVGTIDERCRKYARHAFRLTEQGRRLLAEGQLHVRVENRGWYLNDLNDMTMPQMVDEFNRRLSLLESTPTPLTDSIDIDRASRMLVKMRLSLLEQ